MRPVSLLTRNCRRHLGSRVIPFIQLIVDASLSIISAAQSTPATVKQAFSTVSALVETVPTFIAGKQLTSILRAAIAHRAKDEAVSSAVLSKTAKKISTKSMFLVLMDMWKTVQKEDETVRIYLCMTRTALMYLSSQ